MENAPKPPIEFMPGSKVIFVAGGYRGGEQRVGVVLGITADNLVLLCMLDDEAGAASGIEGYDATWLGSEIAAGRLEGSLKETRYVPSINPCLPLLPHARAGVCPGCMSERAHKVGCPLVRESFGRNPCLDIG